MAPIDPVAVQVLAALLLGLGVATALLRRNLFFVLMGVELMLNAANLSLVGFSRTFAGDRALVGQLVPLFVIAVAAAEACVALAMVVLLARARGTVDSDAFSRMRE